jgi:FRG domain
MRLPLQAHDRFFVDNAAVFQALCENFPKRLPDAAVDVAIDAPDYATLRAFIKRQAATQPPEIAADQNRALAHADARMRATAEWAARILGEIGKRYGYRAAAQSACAFVTHRLIRTVGALAQYQIAAEPPIYPDFVEWFDRDYPRQSAALVAHRQSQVQEVLLRSTKAKAYSRVYLPLGRLGRGRSPSGLCENIPLDIWLEYVVAQCAVEQSLDVSGYFEWTPADGTFSAEPSCWSMSGGKAVQSPLPGIWVNDSTTRHDEGGARALIHCLTDPPVTAIGPLPEFPPGTLIDAVVAQEWLIRAQITQIDSRTWRAPTVWHAVVWLLNLARWDRSGRPDTDADVASKMAAMEPGALLFRGQADCAWGLVPTIYREGRNTQDNWRAMTRLMLALMFLQLSADSNTTTPMAQLGAGQHYGLDTALLDFSFDPSIAAYFASDSERPDLGPEAAIYWLPLQQAFRLGAQLIIAPYWLERIHRQRGCFLDLSDFMRSGNADLKHDCFSIRFPRSPNYLKDFHLNNKQLLPESKWMHEAIRWARNSKFFFGNDSSNRIVCEEYANELVQFAGKPDFIVGSMDPRYAGVQVRLFTEMIEWLALTKDGPTERKFHLDCEVVKALAEHNQGVFMQIHHVGKFLLTLNDVPEESRKLAAYVSAVGTCLESWGAWPFHTSKKQ